MKHLGKAQWKCKEAFQHARKFYKKAKFGFEAKLNAFSNWLRDVVELAYNIYNHVRIGSLG